MTASNRQRGENATQQAGHCCKARAVRDVAASPACPAYASLASSGMCRLTIYRSPAPSSWPFISRCDLLTGIFPVPPCTPRCLLADIALRHTEPSSRAGRCRRQICAHGKAHFCIAVRARLPPGRRTGALSSCTATSHGVVRAIADTVALHAVDGRHCGVIPLSDRGLGRNMRRSL